MSAQFAKNSPLSILTTHHEDDEANESSGVSSASQALHGHSCSQRCACGSLNVEGGQTPKSPAKLSSKLFPEVRQVVKGIRRLSATAHSHGFVSRFFQLSARSNSDIRRPKIDLTINEEDSAAYGQL